MKKIIIALALIGISYSGAEAQTKGADSKTPCKCAAIAAKQKATNVPHSHRHGTAASGYTYQVCVEKGGHYQCCMHHKTTTKVVTK